MTVKVGQAARPGNVEVRYRLVGAGAPESPDSVVGFGL